MVCATVDYGLTHRSAVRYLLWQKYASTDQFGLQCLCVLRAQSAPRQVVSFEYNAGLPAAACSILCARSWRWHSFASADSIKCRKCGTPGD